MSISLIFTAFLMGLAGGLHCAGMCGPIMLVMPFQFFRGKRRIMGIGLYHFGRISTYAFLGVILFSFKEMFHPQWQQYFSVGSGIVLLVLGILSFLPQSGLIVKLPWTDWVANRLQKVMWQKGPFWLFVAGSLNGLLPCGMVYMALAAALAASSPMQAALVMYAFGIGTTPVVAAIAIMKTAMPFSVSILRRWTPVIMLIFGCLFVLRGANLGIPGISPKLTQTSTHAVKIQNCYRP